jgi:glycosyltransferase involved in cell wall biosynthesis
MEKAAALFAAGLARRGYTVDFLGGPGPRSRSLEAAGIPMLGIVTSKAELKQYVQEVKPDVVHQHVPGYPIANPLYEIWSELGANAPSLIETNVFGHLTEPQSDKWVRYRMFVSLSCAVKAFNRSGRKLDATAINHATVAYNPLEPITLSFGENERREFRRQIGVRDDETLALRVGQPARPGQPGNKWRRWECQAFARARRSMPGLRFLIMEPPADIWQELEAGCYGSGIIVRKSTSDFAWLQALYASADCMIHASSYGESFGYTIAEAMQAGLPVIARSTPWGDNAQVELVENGQTGFVCGSVAEMSRRLVDLAGDAALRQRMAKAALERIQKKANLDRELDVIEAVLERVVTGKRGIALQQRAEELLQFASDFSSREWRISEPPLSHPLDYFGARFYSAYRTLRTAIGRILRLFRRRIPEASPVC